LLHTFKQLNTPRRPNLFPPKSASINGFERLPGNKTSSLSRGSEMDSHFLVGLARWSFDEDDGERVFRLRETETRKDEEEKWKERETEK
jgi:hypothetical protein